MIEFRSEKISKSVTRIYGITGELMYLVEGDNSAVLVDTGSGIGSLKAYIETLTSKPFSIILTHGHVDHAMGAQEFDVSIYMNKADNIIYSEHSKMEFRKQYIRITTDASSIEEDDYIPVHMGGFLDIKQGDIFELGGVVLEILNVPGHTPGTIAVLIREEHALILGDACNDFTFLFHSSCPSVAAYKQSLIKLKIWIEGKFDKIYISHGSGNAPIDIIDRVIRVCDDILEGNADEVTFEFMGDKGFIAKEIGPSGRVDGGVGNIVYNKDRIFD